jgi:hypothetical protein
MLDALPPTNEACVAEPRCQWEKGVDLAVAVIERFPSGSADYYIQIDGPRRHPQKNVVLAAFREAFMAGPIALEAFGAVLTDYIESSGGAGAVGTEHYRDPRLGPQGNASAPTRRDARLRLVVSDS